MAHDGNKVCLDGKAINGYGKNKNGIGIYLGG